MSIAQFMMALNAWLEKAEVPDPNDFKMTIDVPMRDASRVLHALRAELDDIHHPPRPDGHSIEFDKPMTIMGIQVEFKLKR